MQDLLPHLQRQPALPDAHLLSPPPALRGVLCQHQKRQEVDSLSLLQKKHQGQQSAKIQVRTHCQQSLCHNQGQVFLTTRSLRPLSFDRMEKGQCRAAATDRIAKGEKIAICLDELNDRIPEEPAQRIEITVQN